MIERLVLRFLRWRNGRRHRRCLARIEVLERELFPEWFPAIPWMKGEDPAELALKPGARWLVEDPKSIQYVESANYHQSVVSAFRRHAGSDGTLRPGHHDKAVETFRATYHELQAKNLARSAWAAGLARRAAEHQRAIDRAYQDAVRNQQAALAPRAGAQTSLSPEMMLQRALAMSLYPLK